MRIRIPRRIVLLGVLLTALALASTSALPTYAKPINWYDPDNPTGPTGGDGDGSVVKARAFSTTTTSSTLTRTDSTNSTGSRVWKGYLAALRLGYGWRFFW